MTKQTRRKPLSVFGDFLAGAASEAMLRRMRRRARMNLPTTYRWMTRSRSKAAGFALINVRRESPPRLHKGVPRRFARTR